MSTEFQPSTPQQQLQPHHSRYRGVTWWVATAIGWLLPPVARVTTCASAEAMRSNARHGGGAHPAVVCHSCEPVPRLFLHAHAGLSVLFAGTSGMASGVSGYPCWAHSITSAGKSNRRPACCCRSGRQSDHVVPDCAATSVFLLRPCRISGRSHACHVCFHAWPCSCLHLLLLMSSAPRLFLSAWPLSFCLPSPQVL